MFYIISLTHTVKSDSYITLWRPKNAGYCYTQEMAGLYQNPEKGYHDSDSNMPISEDKFNKIAIEFEYEDSGNIVHCLPNCVAVWKILGVFMTKNGLQKRALK